jgi:hypothetical protein
MGGCNSPPSSDGRRTLEADPGSDEVFLAATKIVNRAMSPAKGATGPYAGSFRTSSAFRKLAAKCGLDDVSSMFRSRGAADENVVLDTPYGRFVVASTVANPTAEFRLAIRTTDGACAALHRGKGGAAFSLAGASAPNAALIAYDALQFPTLRASAQLGEAELRTRALGVIDVYAALHNASVDALEAATQAEPPVANSESHTEPTNQEHYAGVFEYEDAEVRLGMEFRPAGILLVVRNVSSEPIEISPKDIVILTTEGRFSPLTLHDLHLMGAGVPGMAAEIRPDQRRDFALSGICTTRGACASNAVSSRAETVAPGAILSASIGGRPLRFTGE